VSGLSAARIAAVVPAALPPTRPDDLRSACQEFEGLLLGMLLREMYATVSRSGLLGANTGREVFEDLWTQELARLAARASPLGVADQLERALTAESRQQGETALKLEGRATEEIADTEQERRRQRPRRRKEI